MKALEIQQPKRLITIGVVVLSLGLLLQFPARTAYAWFAPEALKLSGLSGTVWHGTAAEGMAGDIYLRNIRWYFRPLALFGGKLAVVVSADPATGFINSEVAVTPTGTLLLRDLAGSLSLSSFQDSFQLKGFHGDLNLQFEEIAVRDGLPVRAVGSIGLARLRAPQLSGIALGDFRAEFHSDESGIIGSVENLSGALQVAGVIRLGPDRSYSFTGQVAATPQAPELIRQQLQMLGSADERGQREFRIEGQF